MDCLTTSPDGAMSTILSRKPLTLNDPFVQRVQVLEAISALFSALGSIPTLNSAMKIAKSSDLMVEGG